MILNYITLFLTIFQGFLMCNINTNECCKFKLWNDLHTLWQVYQKIMIIFFCNKGREPFNEVCWLSTIYLLSTQRHASDTLNGTMVNGSMLHKW